jgi:hypothetical protein
VAIEVLATPRAEQQIDALDRRRRRTVELFLDLLAAEGCNALAYRLTGDLPLDHLCVKHLDNNIRVVVAFEATERAWVLLVGPHEDGDAVLNIYAELYRLLGVEPPDARGRTKPPCCDATDQTPPVLGTVLDEIVERASQVRRTRRSR